MSSERNIIKVYFKGTHLVYSKTQYQYNHGMILHFADLNLPQAFEAHFANKQNGTSKTMIGSENKVEIPDEYFWSGANEIYAWVYLHSDVDDGETVYEVRIPLVKRAKPTDEEPLPEQESTINRAIAELNHAVEQTSADAEQTSADRETVTALRDEVIDLRDEAEQSAQTATAKADEASASASSASDSEQNANNYANDAKRYAENAFSSKEIAVASASEAEQAKEDAEQARDDAQDARSDTIQLKQDVVGLKDDVTNLKDNVVNLKDNVVSLKDDVIDLKEQTDTNVTHYPKIVDEYWHVWDARQNNFVNTGVDATGEDGEKGDKGDTGNSGVYIGTDEPTDEEISVWIDTDGQADIIGLRTVKDDPTNGGTLIGAVDGVGANSAIGNCSLAEGLSTVSSGNYSHAEGVATESGGLYSHTEGWHTKALKRSQHVMGEFNIIDNGDGGDNSNTRGNYAFIIGNGTGDNARSNAFAIKWDGTLVLANGIEVSPSDVTTHYHLGNYYIDQYGKHLADIVESFDGSIPLWQIVLISRDNCCFYYAGEYHNYAPYYVWSTPLMYNPESVSKKYYYTFTTYDYTTFEFNKIILDEVATTSSNGLMSSTDKQHLDEIYSALKASGVI